MHQQQTARSSRQSDMARMGGDHVLHIVAGAIEGDHAPPFPANPIRRLASPAGALIRFVSKGA
ncbi:MAG TPA: hypothetical protein VKQ09_08070 [Sphingomonas sp.]|nr:hypothetical protein [Sphingomonas sp.]